MIKSHKNLIILVLFWAITVLVYLWFLHSDYLVGFERIAKENAFSFFITLVGIKIVGIVWPPIPGGIFTLFAIPILGWKEAFLADYTGALAGSFASYFLGRKYGLSLLYKLFDEDVIQKIQSIRIKKDHELEGVFLARVFGSSLFLEAISYGAGLLKINFSNFALATIVASFIIGLPFFYLAGGILSGKQGFINAGLIAILAIILWKFRGRYFE